MPSQLDSALVQDLLEVECREQRICDYTWALVPAIVVQIDSIDPLVVVITYRFHGGRLEVGIGEVAPLGLELSQGS
jgi:hypothetical protein